MYMKKIIYYLGAFLVLWGLFTGCYDDKSKTARIPMPKITILGDEALSGDRSNRIAYVGEECELDCKVNWGTEDSTQYDFKWTYNGEEISQERVCRYTFNESGSTYVTFQVIQKSTGLSWGASLSVTVSAKYLLGWLILSDKEGRSALDFIHIDTYELYPDIYKTLHPDKPLGSQPFRLEQHFTSAYDEILVMQRGEPGLVELDGRNFSQVIQTKDEFIGEKYPYEGFDPVQVCYANGTISGVELLLTAKGEVYARMNKTVTSQFQTAQYPTIPLEYPGGMEITTFTFPKPTYYQLMFDNKNKRWLAIYKSSSNDKMLPLLVKNYDEEEFPDYFDFCNGMDQKMELVYAQTCDEWGGDCYLINILKDTETGKYYFQKCYLTWDSSTNTIKVSQPVQKEFAAGYNLTEDSQFWMLRGQNTYFQDSPHVFFTVDKKVYFYREQNDKYYLYKDCNLGENPPTGKIVSIHTNAVVSEMGIAFSDGHFYICNLDPEEVVNAIARGNIDPSTPAVNAELEIKHYSGLGNIVHSIFKYGRFSNWSSAEDRYR
ncbi:hypothetical protein DMB45_13390 [Sanguibacteroides justesenii]|uniref:Ig-like domain-containing protein n=2 Tax=Sanguibacteroides justesenii TaxID=1547597 RepID=A0A0C3MEX7_9PORP|nr:hypothetical protein BA92_08435 [Sanguibacteroides justesenii]PXZ42819.1 hypothetical protein DMB45_13390 [Sanguibacteroides justesenii]